MLSILNPFLVHILKEGALPALNIGLYDTIKVGLVPDVVNFMTTISSSVESEVGLEFESTGQLVIHDDLTAAHHGLVHLRVVVEESLRGVEVTNCLVDAQFMQEGFQSGETMLSNAFTVDIQGEPLFALFVLRELNVDKFRVALSDGLEDDPGGKNVSLAPLLLLSVEVLQSADALVEHLEPARVVNIIPFGLSTSTEDLERLSELNKM